MSPARNPTMKCPLCGMKHAITPEMAGQEIKCRCGHVLRPPAAPPREWGQDQQEIYRMVPETTAPTKGTVHPNPVEPPPPRPPASTLPGTHRRRVTPKAAAGERPRKP